MPPAAADQPCAACVLFRPGPPSHTRVGAHHRSRHLRRTVQHCVHVGGALVNVQHLLHAEPVVFLQLQVLRVDGHDELRHGGVARPAVLRLGARLKEARTRRWGGGGAGHPSAVAAERDWLAATCAFCLQAGTPRTPGQAAMARGRWVPSRLRSRGLLTNGHRRPPDFD